MTDADRMNAALQELAIQRNLLGERAVNLAIVLAEAQQKLKELEDKLVALAKSEVATNVVDLKKGE